MFNLLLFPTWLCLVTLRIPIVPYLVLWEVKQMAGQANLPPGEAGGGAARVTVAGGEVGFRAELAGDAQSSTTLGRTVRLDLAPPAECGGSWRDSSSLVDDWELLHLQAVPHCSPPHIFAVASIRSPGSVKMVFAQVFP